VNDFTVIAGTVSTSASNYYISVTSNVVFNGGTLSLGASTMSVTGNWTYSSGNFVAGASTVIFNGTGVQRLSGSTTFYGLRALTSGATLQFSAGTTQYVTNKVEFRNNYLRSNSDNATWYFTYTGSSQTLVSVDVKDSNAGGGSGMNTVTSTNSGNNTNWYFGQTTR
jgi:hypothetical protein